MMRRIAVVTLLLGFAAWTGAQGPTPALSTSEQLRLLRSNRILIEESGR